MRVKRQLELLEDYFSQFIDHRLKGQSIYAVERLAQLVIQSLLDLGAMMLISLGRRKPETYRDIASELAGIISLTEERRFLEGLAGFRNILVHGYALINRDMEEEVFREMEKRLPRIINAVKGFIEKSRLDPKIDEKLIEVFKRHKVKFAFLFGSRARCGEGRDYDIAVSIDVKSAIKLGELLVDIANALGVHEDLIDLIHIESSPQAIIYTILNEGKLIYGDPSEAYHALYKRYIEILDMNETYRIAHSKKKAKRPSLKD